MKKALSFILALLLLLGLCACRSASTPTTSTQHNSSTISAQIDTLPSYYGTWEITGLSSFSGDPSNMTVKISKSGITIQRDGESVGPFAYTESFDSYYTYLEVEDDSMSFAIVQFNDDMIGICQSVADIGRGSYTAKTPCAMEINGDIDVFNILMRKGAGTTTLPSSFDLDKTLADSEFEDYEEYIYYPSSRILQLCGYGFAVFYIDKKGHAEYMESIALINLDSSRYVQHDIFTDSNFVIIDNK